MKKIKILFINSILTFLVVFCFNPFNAEAYSFSSSGYTAVENAASIYYSGSGLTRNELVALMLSVTWPETGANNTGTPSPMTLSRADNSSGLWSFKNKTSTNKEKRAFWHPGIGVFQLDSAGMGAQLGIHERINIATAAPVVANHIVTKYKKNPSNTKQSRRAEAWAQWYACNNNKCENIFNSIYNSTTDKVTVTKDTSVSSTGGMITRSCNIIGSSATFSCYEINPANAQGYTYFSSFTPEGSLTSSTSPLTSPLITFVLNGSEERYWFKERTGYSRDIRASRPISQNARTYLTWRDLRDICVSGSCGSGPLAK